MKRNLMMTLCVMIIAMLTVALARPAFAATTTNPNNKTMIADNANKTVSVSDNQSANDQSATKNNKVAAKEKLFIRIGALLILMTPVLWDYEHRPQNEY